WGEKGTGGGAGRAETRERRCPPWQNQEGRLKGILGLVLVAQGRPADPQDHRAVTLYERRERDLGCMTAPGGKPLQKLAIAQPGDCPFVEERIQGTRQDAFIANDHECSPPGSILPSSSNVSHGEDGSLFFFRAAARRAASKRVAAVGKRKARYGHGR